MYTHTYFHTHVYMYALRSLDLEIYRNYKLKVYVILRTVQWFIMVCTTTVSEKPKIYVKLTLSLQYIHIPRIYTFWCRCVCVCLCLCMYMVHVSEVKVALEKYIYIKDWGKKTVIKNR